MSIPRSSVPVNTPVALDRKFDADARAKRAADEAARAEKTKRLAMTAAEMIRAAENRWQQEYKLGRRHQGGYGYIEIVLPVEDEQSAPWVHLLPVDGDAYLYLVRGTGAHYGSPDWAESEQMSEWLTDRDDGASWATAVMP